MQHILFDPTVDSHSGGDHSGSDHSGYNPEFRVKSKITSKSKTSLENIFKLLTTIEQNPVIRVGNNISFESKFNPDTRTFQIIIIKFDPFNRKIVEFTIEDLAIIHRDPNDPNDPNDPLYKFSQALNEIIDSEFVHVQNPKYKAREIIDQNFSADLEAKLLKDIILPFLKIINGNRVDADKIFDEESELEDDKIKLFAKILSPFGSSISPIFSLKEKDDFIKYFRNNSLIMRYLFLLREYSPAKISETLWDGNKQVNSAIGNYQDDSIFIYHTSKNEESGRLWVKNQIAILKSDYQNKVINYGDTHSCQQVRILYTKDYLTDDEHASKEDVPKGAMVILHVDKFGVTQDVIAMDQCQEREIKDGQLKNDGAINIINSTFGIIIIGMNDLNNPDQMNDIQNELHKKFFQDYSHNLNGYNDTLNTTSILELLKSDDPSHSSMQGRLAKHVYEIGALSKNTKESGNQSLVVDFNKIAFFKIAQDYLDSQVNVKTDYRRVQTFTSHPVEITSADLEDKQDGKEVNAEIFEKILYNFKNNFGEISVSCDEPQFYDGSIKITRKQDHPHLIDIVRVIPQDESQKNKSHNVQYVAIKDRNGIVKKRNIVEDDGNEIKIYCYKKVTLTDNGPDISDQVFYYNAQGQVESIDANKINDLDFRDDLARMQIRASVVSNDHVISKLSIAVHDGENLVFATNKILSQNYRNLDEAVISMVQNKTTNAGFEIDISDLEFKNNAKDYFSFKTANTDKRGLSYSELTLYHDGYIADNVVKEKNREINDIEDRDKSPLSKTTPVIVASLQNSFVTELSSSSGN
jgi:hypothetical protein